MSHAEPTRSNAERANHDARGDEARFAAAPPETRSPKAGEVAASWYVSPKREVPDGWIVYSFDFILASLQRCTLEPHRVRRTPGWIVAGRVVQAVLAACQAIICLLASIPIISMFVEFAARNFAGNTIGYFLRSCYWKAKLAYLGQNTMIDQYVDIRGPAHVRIGSHCHIDAFARLKAGDRRYGQHGFIRIGDYVHVGPGAVLAGRGGLVIEDFVSMSADVRLYSASNTIEDPDDPGRLISMSHVAPPGLQHTIEAPVVIEAYVFIGMMTCVLPGVRIGCGAIIHPNCEITRDVPTFAHVGGMPRGRQIGWRQPRRRSPLLAPPGSAT